MRAVTVAVDPISGVGGFVRTGDRVDVVATFNINSGTLTKTILQNAEVLAIGSETSLPGKKPTQNSPQQPPSATATLSVSPDEAEKLVLADSKGKLRLMLRPTQDMAYVRTKGVVGRTILGSVPPDVAEKATPKPSPAPQIKTSPGSGMFVPPAMGRIQPLPVTNIPEPEKRIQVIRGTKVDEVSVPD
jgi:pilus assembly protein CpaB